MNSRSEKGHRSKLVLCGCLALGLLALACNQKTEPDTRATDEENIRKLDAQWSKTAAANDLEGAVSYYSDDASMLPPNAPIASGKQAIREVWKTLLDPAVTVTWQITKVDVARSGDLAYLVGVYQVAPKDPKSKIPADHGKLVEVWKKQPDGNWKTVADIFNSDVPMPAASEKKM